MLIFRSTVPYAIGPQQGLAKKGPFWQGNGSSTSPQQEVLPFPVRCLNKEPDENRFPHLPKHNPSFPVRFLFKEQ